MLCTVAIDWSQPEAKGWDESTGNLLAQTKIQNW